MLLAVHLNVFNRGMERLHETERKEQLKDFSAVEVQEVLLNGTSRAVIIPQMVTGICRRSGQLMEPARDEMSILRSDSGLSNYHPMGPDTLRPEIGEYFRMMHLDEIVDILESDQRDVSNVRSRLLTSYLLSSHLRLEEKPSPDPHNGGWGGIMTNHAIRISHSRLEMTELDKLAVKRKYRNDDSFEGLYPTQEDDVNAKVYDLSQLYSKYSPPKVTLKQIDKCCPDFIEELFKREFEDLPPFLQDAVFDLPFGEGDAMRWQPLSLALSLRIKKPAYGDSFNLSHSSVEVVSTCIGSTNQSYAGNAWFIDK